MLIHSGSKCNSPLEKSFPKFRGVTVQIPIDQSVKPVVQPYRRIPIPLEEKVAKKLKELKDADIIEEVNEPSPWVSPIVPVLKESSLAIKHAFHQLEIHKDCRYITTFSTSKGLFRYKRQ
ncbi:unnamed protein product [Euphydryas editha]|uniref:Reverse transcriptase domain-containing protein n=1 Tax=Euphydryas editha TaxID=104508 RepID=A0AAU9VCF5_EUPED|nr:unnamed protein product [Euphydryas editha]